MAASIFRTWSVGTSPRKRRLLRGARPGGNTAIVVFILRVLGAVGAANGGEHMPVSGVPAAAGGERRGELHEASGSWCCVPDLFRVEKALRPRNTAMVGAKHGQRKRREMQPPPLRPSVPPPLRCIEASLF